MAASNVSNRPKLRPAPMLVAFALSSAVAPSTAFAAGDNEQSPGAVFVCEVGKDCHVFVTSTTAATPAAPTHEATPQQPGFPIDVLIFGVVALGIAVVLADAARARRKMTVDADLGRLALREMAPKGGAALALLHAHSAAIVAVEKNADLGDGATASAALLARACEEFLDTSR